MAFAISTAFFQDPYFLALFLQPFLFLLVLQNILLAPGDFCEKAGLLEAEVLGFADDEVVDQRDFEEQTRMVHPVGHVQVQVRGQQCSAGMVMDEYDVGRPFLEREAEYLRGVHERAFRSAQADKLDQQYVVRARQADDPAVLLVAADLVLAQQDVLHDLVEIAGIQYAYFLFPGQLYSHI